MWHTNKGSSGKRDVICVKIGYNDFKRDTYRGSEKLARHYTGATRLK